MRYLHRRGCLRGGGLAGDPERGRDNRQLCGLGWLGYGRATTHGPKMGGAQVAWLPLYT